MTAFTNTKTVKTTCPYCGVGCGVLATPQPDGSVDIKGDPEHPANFGRLCSKGSSLGETLSLDDRILHPQIGGKRADWSAALDLVAGTFSDTIRDHGPDSVAFYVSGQILTEDYYVANKLMKGFIGSANIDTNSRLCMASSVAGHRRAFGSDTVPGTYEDLESCDLLVLVGSNLAWCHPVLFQRVEAAKAENPHMRVVVVDPRETATCAIADLHLALKPDTDVALFNGLLAFLADTDALDRSYIEMHTNGFEAALAAAGPCEINRIADETGLSPRDLATFYTMVARTPKTVTVYSQGVNQSVNGTDKVNAIINTHLATGRIGSPGMGPFSATGQPNAMGGREVGGLANMLAAHMAIENPDHRALVQSFWNSPAIAERQGLKAVDMFKAVRDGRVKAIWIMSTNPVDSLPDADAVAAALKACPFVVISDVSHAADTVAFADVLLPAAAWGEKDGTVTNSERRISRQTAFQLAPGDARPDWWQICEVARRMGFEHAFDYDVPAAIFREHATLSGYENNGTRDFDISAYCDLSGPEFDTMQPFQWPQGEGEGPKTTRFFSAGGFFTADRKAFICCRHAGRADRSWATLSLRAQYRQGSRSLAHDDAHRQNAAAFFPYSRAVCGVASRRCSKSRHHGGGSRRSEKPAWGRNRPGQVSARARKGSVFVPMHWTDQFASNGRIDAVVSSDVDPISGQPGSKFTPVALRKLSFDWYGFAVLREKPAGLRTGYWAIAPAHGGWRVELAGRPQDDRIDLVQSLLGKDAELLSFEDEGLGLQRIAGWVGETLAGVFFFGPEPVAVSGNGPATSL